ncbi:hypothetical protein Tco_0718823 [Tanacetum coccineum]
MLKSGSFSTAVRRSSIEAVENVGTRYEPLIIVVMKCLPDSANSSVIHAAAEDEIYIWSYGQPRQEFDVDDVFVDDDNEKEFALFVDDVWRDFERDRGSSWGRTEKNKGVVYVTWNGYLRKGRKTKPKRQKRTRNGKAWKRQSQNKAQV